MTAEQDIAAIDDGGANTAAEVRTALTAVLGRGDSNLIDEQILGASATHLEVGSIPSGRGGLRVVLVLRSDRASGTDVLEVQVGNGTVDTGANYDRFRAFSGPSANGGDGAAGSTALIIADGAPAASATAGFFGVWDFTIPDYDSTSRDRFILGHGFVVQAAASGTRIGLQAWARWVNSSDAIDVVRATPANGPNWVAGSMMQVYAL